MSASMDFSITVDNTEKVLSELQTAVERALEICGGKAETYAKLNCPVDTGLLRNSITHALSGNAPSVSEYYANEGDGHGSYSGAVGKQGDSAVYIGTNVSYGPKIELDHRTKSGFLRKAIESHMDEYKNIIQAELSK